MRPEISITKSALIIAAVGGIFSSAIFLQASDFIQKEGLAHVAIPTSIKKVKSPPRIKSQKLITPILLVIPKIAVRAVVESVGLTLSGAMGTPKNPMNVGWFSLGVQPGRIGTAVIDGHYDFKTGVGAIFYKLDTLVPGDKLHIEDSAGNKFTFVVRELKVFGDRDDTSLVFGSVDGKSHLSLITCAGTLDTVTKTYSHRLVVFLDQEVF